VVLQERQALQELRGLQVLRGQAGRQGLQVQVV
jgi:hypothetical protein